MEQNQKNTAFAQEQEIDLIELIQRLWINRYLIVKITIVFMLLGLIVAFVSPKKYSAQCEIVPQTSVRGASSSVSALARLAGVSIPQSNTASLLSPYVYENIMASAKFQKELMQTKLDFQKADAPVSIYDYYTSKEYNKPSVMGYILKYTIGLPGVIMGAIRGEQPEVDYTEAVKSDGPIETTTKEEYEVMKLLSDMVTIMLDDQKGYVTITVVMPEPLAAAQLAQATVELLQRYITEFRIQKVQSNLDFVQARYDELKADFEDIQSRRARFRDANRDVSKYSARVELERLDAEYSLAMNLYSEMAARLEQSKIDLKETTPILTIINPVTVPYKRSAPRRAVILFVFTLLGGVVGMGLVLTAPTIAQIVDSSKMKGWIKPVQRREA